MTNTKVEHRLIHNPGIDFLRLLDWIDEIDPNDPSLPFGPYLIETIAVISGCCAFEGFVNMVGQKIDQSWENFEKGPISIKKRLEHIYETSHTQVDFSEGIWQEVLELFQMRVSIMHPKFIDKRKFGGTEIPDLFQITANKYPTSETKRIIKSAIDTLLLDNNLKTLRELYLQRYYFGPPRDQN